ncbi:MAG TPA: DNA-directed RNA polymerase subunit beta', partial [Rhodospirillales bacterium]|nr:DNA-directed RNA polymerase subunit beta' [Rhodospirillales bacterium]
FDGDQMAVHVPLSMEAQLESRVLMMSTNNILSPANGKPIIVPSQDIVLGLYYLTLERDGEPGEGMAFTDVGEIQQALDAGAVSLHAKIKSRYRDVDEKGNEIIVRVDTTPGRMLLSEILPRNPNIPFSIINQLLTKKDVSTVLDEVYRHCGQKETVIFADHMMGIGFKYACQAGISFGKDDLVIPKTKEKLVQETEKIVAENEQQYLEGLITQGEKYNKVVDAWSHCTDRVADEMMKAISSEEPGKPINSVYMMAHSGARGSAAQMKQLAGMRGLMAKPSGEIIETPIISNFKEGLSVLEYFNSTHGARKGLADTALKTANSGYLTRRLVDVAQDCIVVTEDCKTKQGISVSAIVEGGESVSPLSEQILGRCASVDIKDPTSNKTLVKAGVMMDEESSLMVEEADVETVMVRSVLTCELKEGVCGKCYGRDLARGTSVNIGEAVGVIAAQSIGEPGTQLTMRTFHIGGAVQRGAEQSRIEANIDAKVVLKNCTTVKNSQGIQVIMSRNAELSLVDDKGRDRARHRLPYGSYLLVKDKAKVKRGDKIAEWDPYTLPMITEKEGVATFVDLVDGLSVMEKMDEVTGIASKVVIDWKQLPKGSDLKPRITLRDKKNNVITLDNDQEARYFLSVDAILSVEAGQAVHAGDVLARIPRESAKTRDITGGLPRVAELFEARKPKDFAIIAESDGRVEFGKDYKNKRRIIVVPLDGNGDPTEYLVPKGRHISVQEGDYVEIGDSLMDGSPVPHDILRVLGMTLLRKHDNEEYQYTLAFIGYQ